MTIEPRYYSEPLESPLYVCDALMADFINTDLNYNGKKISFHFGLASFERAYQKEYNPDVQNYEVVPESRPDGEILVLPAVAVTRTPSEPDRQLQTWGIMRKHLWMPEEKKWQRSYFPRAVSLGYQVDIIAKTYTVANTILEQLLRKNHLPEISLYAKVLDIGAWWFGVEYLDWTDESNPEVDLNNGDDAALKRYSMRYILHSKLPHGVTYWPDVRKVEYLIYRTDVPVAQATPDNSVLLEDKTIDLVP